MPIISVEKLNNANLDAETIEQVVNGEPNVLVESREGRKIPTLATLGEKHLSAGVILYGEKTQEQVNDEVGSALTGLSFANKTYATVAAANADIANIAVNQSVWVSSEAEGGLYEKSTAEATTLTKSPFDPVTNSIAESKRLLKRPESTSRQAKTNISVNGFRPVTQKVPLAVGENGKSIIGININNGDVSFNWEKFDVRRGFGNKPLMTIGEDGREIGEEQVNPSDFVTTSQFSAATNQLNSKVTNNDQKFAGYGLIDFYETIRQKAGKSGRVNIAFWGDSTTQGSAGLSIPDVVYTVLGKKLGYGGLGFVPFDPTAMCTYDSSSFPDVTFFFTKNDWKTWNYFQTNPPSGYKGWGVKGGAYADASTVGMLELNLNLSRRNDYLGFNKFRLFYFAIDGSVTFTANGQEVTVDATDVENPVVSNVLIENVGYDSLADPKLWRVQVQRTGGTGTLHLGGVELINSKGGVVVHRFAIGGYKAADHTGQSAISQRAYYSALNIDLAIINLGQNDSATDAALWKSQIQEIINRIRADASNRPILLVRWWTTTLNSKDSVLNELAEENDLQIVDMRNVVPNAQWSVDKGINLTSSTSDPHLNAKGSNYAARYLLKHLNIESITESLRSE